MMVLPRLQQARRTRLRVDCNDAKREDREHGETLHRKEQQETCITIYSIEIKNVVPVCVLLSCISTFYNCTTVFILFQDGRMVQLSCICTIAPILHHMYFKRKLRIVFEVT